MDSLEALIADVKASNCLSWDLESTSLTDNPRDALIPKHAKVTHVAMASSETAGCWDASEEVLEVLCGFLKNPDVYAMVFNAPYDHAVLHHQGHLNHKDFKAHLVDVLGLVWMADEEDQHGLKYSVKKYLRMKMIEFNDVVANSPAAQKRATLLAPFTASTKIIKGWTAKSPKRPYPEWSDAPKSRTAIRLALREADPKLTAKEAQAVAEGLLDEKYLDEYKAWLEEERAKVQPAVDKCDERINKHMKKYATADAANLIKLYKKVMPILRKERTEHILEVEMAVRMETIDMRIHGMPVQPAALRRIGDELDPILEELRANVYDLAKREFNINSADQVRDVIFRELCVPPPAEFERRGVGIPGFTSGGDKLMEEMKNDGQGHLLRGITCDLDTIPEKLIGSLKCNAVILERLAHPIGQAILDYRTAAKLKSTYVDALLAELEDSGDGRVHGAFNSFGTVTGRFACVHESTPIVTSRGTFPISEIPRKLKPWHSAVTTETHLGRQRRITDVWAKGIDEMYEVELENGETIKCTADHRFLVDGKWVKLKDLPEWEGRT